MKKIVSILLCACLVLAALPAAGAAAQTQTAEQTVVALGIMTPDQNGSLNLGRNVTRAEFTKMLAQASVYKDNISSGSGSSPYKDVKYNHWAADYIKNAVDAKWMTGYIDGTFRPNDSVTLEVAASALLKLLGYTTADLNGAYPNAQISKFRALGLDDGVSLAQGKALTRADAARVFHNLMEAETKSGSLYGATLGYPMTAAGELDYSALVLRDKKGPFVLSETALSAASLPFELSKATVYRDGKLSSAGAVKQMDVYYYNSTIKTIWAYGKKASGVLTAVSPNLSAPSSVTVSGEVYSIGSSEAKTKLGSFGSFSTGDAVTLLLGMDDEVVDVLPGGDEVDYWEYVTANIEGPYVNKGTGASGIVPFDMAGATVYRNNSASSPGAIERYDVIYYNEKAKTVWAYSERAVGVYTSAAPSAVSPDSVTVSGNSYKLGTSEAKKKVSTAGEFAVGDAVALLLGMEGSVVDVIPAAEVDASYYGVVTKFELGTYAVDTSTSKMEYTLSVACTDGVIRQCAVAGKYYEVGNIVEISYQNGAQSVKGVSRGNLYGKVSSDGKTFGNLTISENVEIIDTLTDGKYTKVQASRLAGVNFEQSKIAYYALNKNGEISHMILNDATGDLQSYVIVTKVSEYGGDIQAFRGTYNYILNGASGTYTTTSRLFGISAAPAVIIYKDGAVSDMRNLSSAAIDSLSVFSASSGNKKFQVYDAVQVYVRTGSGSSQTYTLTDLSAVNSQDYSLTGYYETVYPASGQIRIIIAVQR